MTDKAIETMTRGHMANIKKKAYVERRNGWDNDIENAKFVSIAASKFLSLEFRIAEKAE